MNKTAKMMHEAIADYVAAEQMLGRDIPLGAEITFDHCFGDESTDARKPKDSWTRVRATVEQSHLDRAEVLGRESRRP